MQKRAAQSPDRILRSFFGAIEDWNLWGLVILADVLGLRSFFGAIEDWNFVAVALGLLTVDCDRSSGRSRIGTKTQLHPRLRRHCDRSSGRSRIGTQVDWKSRAIVTDCDRSSGRSRIGTK